MPGPAPVTDADADLLRRAAAGELAAFDLLMRRYEDAVWRFARLRTDVQQDAEDIMQETFVAAWRHAGSYAGAGSVRGWLLGIARNTAARYYRRHAGEPAHLEPLDQIALDAGWGAVEADTQLSDDRELVATALARLPAEDREVLMLREIEGFSGEETAELLGLSLSAMKSRLHRARLKLVAALRELNDVTA